MSSPRITAGTAISNFLCPGKNASGKHKKNQNPSVTSSGGDRKASQRPRSKSKASVVFASGSDCGAPAHSDDQVLLTRPSSMLSGHSGSTQTCTHSPEDNPSLPTSNGASVFEYLVEDGDIDQLRADQRDLKSQSDEIRLTLQRVDRDERVAELEQIYSSLTSRPDAISLGLAKPDERITEETLDKRDLALRASFSQQLLSMNTEFKTRCSTLEDTLLSRISQLETSAAEQSEEVFTLRRRLEESEALYKRQAVVNGGYKRQIGELALHIADIRANATMLEEHFSANTAKQAATSKALSKEVSEAALNMPNLFKDSQAQQTEALQLHQEKWETASLHIEEMLTEMKATHKRFNKLMQRRKENMARRAGSEATSLSSDGCETQHGSASAASSRRPSTSSMLSVDPTIRSKSPSKPSFSGNEQVSQRGEGPKKSVSFARSPYAATVEDVSDYERIGRATEQVEHTIIAIAIDLSDDCDSSIPGSWPTRKVNNGCP